MIPVLKRRVAAATAACIMALATAAAVRAAAPDPDVTARSEVSHTAMYVGDRIAFTVRLALRRQLDVLPEDLGADKLKLEGLDALTREMTRSEDADGTTTYVVRYFLTTYRVDAPLLKISPMTVRYYVRRPGQDVRDAVPAGTVRVPGAVVAFRSVLPEGQAVAGARDAGDPAPRPRLYSLLRSLGLALLVLGAVPAFMLVLDIVRAVRRHAPAARQQSSRRRSRQQARATVTALAERSPGTVEERRDAFARLDAAVREHVTDVWHVPVRTLDADRAAAVLDQQGGSFPAGAAADVLRTCEVALYGPPEAVPSSDEWRQAVARGEQIVATG